MQAQLIFAKGRGAELIIARRDRVAEALS